MRSKKFLALTLAFCMACSGTVSVGASVSDNQKEEQQGDVLEETDESGQVQKDESSAPEALENEGIENDGNLISGPEEPQGQQEEPAGSEEPAELENLADAEDSGNAKLEESGVVDEKCWDLKNTPQYKLRKSENSEEYFTAADGIAAVRKNGADAYYVFDQNGVMQTGLYTISRNGTETYYFLTAEDTKKDCNESEDGIIIPNPLNSRIGQMVTEEGWIQVGDRWLYMKEGGGWDTSMVGMQKLPDGKVYCLSENGVIEKDVLRTISDNTYYFGEDGVMITDQEKILDDTMHYFGTDGAMVINAFQKVGDKQYYFDEQGKRLEQTGWQKLGGSWYYFNKDFSRVIKTKWQKITEDGSTEYYYFDEEGKMAKDQFVKSDSYMYWVDSTGCRVTGLQKIDGAYYYFRPQKEDGAPVGSACKGWVKEDGRWYRFKSDFQAQTSPLILIGSKYYSFTKTGKMYKGGLKEIDGKYYYFENQTDSARKGYAVTNKWVKKGGKWYYATAKAYMKTNGWLKNKGKYYYFGKDSVMVKNKWMQRNGKWGYLDGDGVFSQNWVKVQGDWKYAQKDGTFAKGWTTVKRNGAQYRFYFNKKGVLVQDVRNRISGPYMLKVDRKRNQVTVYAKDSNGQYNTPVVAFPCSVGLPATPTPTGTFIGTRAGRWQELMGPSYGQYATLVDAANGIFIHSVAGRAPNINSLPYGEWNKLGRSSASHGCIRVAVADAKWIYQNCNGSTVEVRDYANAGPFDQKTYRKINSSYKWDPTDPEGRGYL